MITPGSERDEAASASSRLATSPSFPALARRNTAFAITSVVFKGLPRAITPPTRRVNLGGLPTFRRCHRTERRTGDATVHREFDTGHIGGLVRCEVEDGKRDVFCFGK